MSDPLRLIFFVAFLLAACAAPVTVERVDPRTVHRELTGNVLTVGAESGASRIVLDRWDLTERFESDPEGALAQICIRPSPMSVPAETSFSPSPNCPSCTRSRPANRSITWRRRSMPMLCSFRRCRGAAVSCRSAAKGGCRSLQSWSDLCVRLGRPLERSSYAEGRARFPLASSQWS